MVYFLKSRIHQDIIVEPGHTISDYARNVVALGEMEHQTAGLSEPEG
jgi:hypothetical protein